VFLEDLAEVTTCAGVERFEAPIVEDEEPDAGETAQDAGIAAVTAGMGSDVFSTSAVLVEWVLSFCRT
jgi:hypothetical protein